MTKLGFSRVFGLIVLAAAVLSGQTASAGLLLDTGPAPAGGTTRSGESGFGQAVAVTNTTQLTQFAMYLQVSGAGHIKYLVFDGTNSTLLASDTLTVTNATPSFVLSDPLSLTLNAGSTYYFGVIEDANTTINAPFFFPATTVSQNGLTALGIGNSNYFNYASPTVSSGGGVTFPLQIFGTQASAVPEPSTMMMLAGGLASSVLLVRSRRTAKRSA